MRLAVGLALLMTLSPGALAHSLAHPLEGASGGLSGLSGVSGAFANAADAADGAGGARQAAAAAPAPEYPYFGPLAPERTAGSGNGPVAQAMGMASSEPAAEPAGAWPLLPAPAAAGAPEPDAGTLAHVTRAPAPRQVFGPAGTSDITFVCPTSPTGLPIAPTGTADDPVVYGCPIRIHDTTYTLGNAAIALNHADHRQVIFASLHGGASTNGPHDRSRQDPSSGVQTAFTSTDQGLRWLDQPPSSSQEPSNDAFGSDADVVLDSGGNVYLAYLYDLATGPQTWDSVVGLFKGPTVEAGYDLSDVYNDPYYYIGRDQDNRIARASLVHVPSHIPVLDVEEDLNETAPPANESAQGEIAGHQDYANATEERVAVAWHEAAFDYATSVTGLSGWIDVAWTDVGPQNKWHRLNKTQLIGPCSDGSNPVAWKGSVYVACVVDRGYKDRARARVGDIDLWKVDLETGNTSLVGFSGFSDGGHPMLSAIELERGARLGMLTQKKAYGPDGRMTHLQVGTGFGWAVGILENGSPFARSIGNLGGILRTQFGGGSNVPILDADVTAFQLTGQADTALIVYKEWHDDPQQPDFKPEDVENDPLRPIGNHLLDYNKYLVSFDSCGSILAGYHVQLGQGVDAFNAEQYTINSGAFNNVRDGLFLTTGSIAGGVPEELLYFAIDDYGAMQYGAVQVAAVSGTCGVGFPPPPLPPAALPQALTVSNSLTTLVGASFAVPAVAMLGYLLTVKRRAPSVAVAEDK